jgi:hypothetical protein
MPSFPLRRAFSFLPVPFSPELPHAKPRSREAAKNGRTPPASIPSSPRAPLEVAPGPEGTHGDVGSAQAESCLSPRPCASAREFPLCALPDQEGDLFAQRRRGAEGIPGV